MKRDIYQITIPYNFPFTFYEKDGKLINICDELNPEPHSVYIGWSPENNFITSGTYNTKVVFPPVRVKKEHLSQYIKINLPELIDYAEKYEVTGNIFIIIKDATDDEILIGMAVRDAFGEDADKMIFFQE